MAEQDAKVEIADDITALVLEHHAYVYRYAYHLTGCAADAEDITQQAFLLAQQRLGQLERKENGKAWLSAIVRNCFFRLSERQRPTNATNLGVDLDAIAVEEDAELPVDPAALKQAIGDLPAEYRVVVVMFYYEDLLYREIAEKLELPLGTVMSRLARAKRQLRAALSDAQVVLPRVDGAL